MEQMIEPYLNGFALFLLLCISIGGVYLVIYIHDIPYEIAKKRNHPHQDAFHVAGWVSLFLMHSIWPLLWIWAYWYKEDAPPKVVVERSKSETRIANLEAELTELKQQLNSSEMPVKSNEENESKTSKNK